MDISKVVDISPERKHLNILIAVSVVFSLGLASGFIYSEAGSDIIESTDLNVEANSSESIKTVEFYNKSIDIFVEDGANTTFYLDKNKDGSADDTFDVERDGTIHQGVKFLDYRDNIYRLYYRYSDDPETEDDGWIEVYRVEKLK